MNLRLVAIRSLERNYCEGEFVFDQSHEIISSRFRVDDSGAIPLVMPESDIFRTYDGTATELRSINAAILAFCRVATGSLP